MGRSGLLKPYMRPIYAGAQVGGTAVTVLLHPGDNWMLHVAAEQIRPGDIVVAAVTTDCTDGYFGDLLATSFQARGARASSSMRGVRDVRVLTEMKFPGVEQGDLREGHGQGDARLGEHAGRVRGRAGESGRCRSSRTTTASSSCRPAMAQKTLETRPRAKRTKAQKRAKLASGVLGLDMYSMREPLQKAGLKYID